MPGPPNRRSTTAGTQSLRQHGIWAATSLNFSSLERIELCSFQRGLWFEVRIASKIMMTPWTGLPSSSGLRTFSPLNIAESFHHQYTTRLDSYMITVRICKLVAETELEPSEVCSDSWRHFDIDKGEKHSSTRADKQNVNQQNPTRGSLATFWILRVWRGHSGFGAPHACEALRNHRGPGRGAR